jgi:hypothetical protein
MSSIVMPSGTTNAVMYMSMTMPPSAPVLARWAAPRPCTAPLATMPPYEWATTMTSCPRIRGPRARRASGTCRRREFCWAAQPQSRGGRRPARAGRGH